MAGTAIVWVAEGTWPACVDAARTWVPDGDDVVLLHVAGGELAAAHGALAGLLGRGRRGPEVGLDALSAEAVAAPAGPGRRSGWAGPRATEQRSGRVEREVVAAADGAVGADLRPRRRPEPVGPAQPRAGDAVRGRPRAVPGAAGLAGRGAGGRLDPAASPAGREAPASPAARAALSAAGYRRCTGPDGLDDGLEQRTHRRQVAVGRRPCGVDVRVAVDVLPAQPVAGVAGELGEEGALGAAVAFAERVQRVDLGEQCGQAVEEGVAVAAAQVVRGGEAAEDVRGGVDDLVRQAERRPGLDDEHGAQLPGPRVDVLEDRPVEGAQVVEVVLARQAPTLDWSTRIDVNCFSAVASSARSVRPRRLRKTPLRGSR